MFKDPTDTLVVRDLQVAADLHGQRVELSVHKPEEIDRLGRAKVDKQVMEQFTNLSSST